MRARGESGPPATRGWVNAAWLAPRAPAGTRTQHLAPPLGDWLAGRQRRRCASERPSIRLSSFSLSVCVSLRAVPPAAGFNNTCTPLYVGYGQREPLSDEMKRLVCLTRCRVQNDRIGQSQPCDVCGVIWQPSYWRSSDKGSKSCFLEFIDAALTLFELSTQSTRFNDNET